MRKWLFIMVVGLSLAICAECVAQSHSEFMLIRRPVVKNPLTYKLTKSFTQNYWSTQLFINSYSGVTGYVMTPAHQLLSGMSFHLDRDWNRLVYAESQANWIRAYGSRGSGAGQILWAQAVDAHSLCNVEGYLPHYYVYILDTGNHRIVKLRYNWQTEAMEWLGTIGQAALDVPSDLVINNGGTFLDDSDDYLWVIDRCYLKRFTPDGILRTTYGSYGKPATIGEFCTPTAIVCGRSYDPDPPYDNFANNNYIYVADPLNNRIVWLQRTAGSEDIQWRDDVFTTADIADL